VLPNATRLAQDEFALQNDARWRRLRTRNQRTQRLRRDLAEAARWLPHNGQGRVGDSGPRVVVKAEQGNIDRATQPQFLECYQRAQAEEVVVEE
jgi:hypothetical protein